MIWPLPWSSLDTSFIWKRVMMIRKTWLVEGNNPVTKTQRPLPVRAGGPHPSIWSPQSSWLYHNQQWHKNKDTHTKTENKDTETKTVPRCQAPAYTTTQKYNFLCWEEQQRCLKAVFLTAKIQAEVKYTKGERCDLTFSNSQSMASCRVCVSGGGVLVVLVGAIVLVVLVGGNSTRGLQLP